MLTLEDQLAHFDRNAAKAYARCLREFKDCKQTIIAEARSRLIAGFAEYGDEGYRRTWAELRDARLEEYADAINYRLMSVYQGWR
jgi:hypothetical protein